MKKVQVVADVGAPIRYILYQSRYGKSVERLLVDWLQDSRGLDALNGLSCEAAQERLRRARYRTGPAWRIAEDPSVSDRKQNEHRKTIQLLNSLFYWSEHAPQATIEIS